MAMASCEVETIGEDGCTPGFWKANADKWEAVAWPTGQFMTVDVDPEASFLDMFMITEDVELRLAKGNVSTDNGDSDDPTLFGALGARGGGENAAARHCTAALLNALDDEVNFGVSADTVKAECSDAFNTTGDDRADALSAVHQKYAELNERGCSQNQQGIANADG